MKALPPELTGANPSSYILDRWQPISAEDKKVSKDLSERSREWVETDVPGVVYGLERWGAMVPENYKEWFAIMVVRPSAYDPVLALSAAGGAGLRSPGLIL